MSLMFIAMAFARLVKRTAVSALVLSLVALPAYSFSWGHHRHSPPQLVIDGTPVLFTVLPTVDRDHVFRAPVDFVHVLGAEYAVASGSDTVTVTAADGHMINVPYTPDDDRCIVDVTKVAQGLGADVDWNSKDDTLALRAKVTVVRVEDDRLDVQTSYPINYSTGALSNPSRIYVDLSGAILPQSQAASVVDSDGVQKIRSKQLDFNTVRIALDMTHVARVAPASTDKSSNIQVALNETPDGQPVAAPPTNVAAVPPDSAASGNVPVAMAPPIVLSPSETPITPLPPPPTDSSIAAKIVGISTQVNSAGKLQVIVLSTGTITDSFLTNTFDKTADKPDRYALDLPASLALPASLGDGPLTVTDPDVKSVRWGTVHVNGVAYTRIVLDLTGPAPYHVTSQPAPDGSGMIYTIEPGIVSIAPPTPVFTPNPGAAAPAGHGSIKGLMVVVDPGHGGKDTGAPGVDGLFEKNLTLAIGKDLRDALADAGARVLMTREDDTFIPLSTRSQMAIDNQADFFISIHCDSGSSRNAQEGSTVYYHGNNGTCKTLAMCIASRFNEANLGIRSDGVRTDYVRFPGSGFSVLRRAGEPAVLCECGYVNNDDDAKELSDPAVEKLIAASIVAGLKDFVGNKVASR